MYAEMNDVPGLWIFIYATDAAVGWRGMPQKQRNLEKKILCCTVVALDHRKKSGKEA